MPKPRCPASTRYDGYMPRNILDTFNPYAMVQPKSEADVLALLDEAIADSMPAWGRSSCNSAFGETLGRPPSGSFQMSF